MNNREKGNFDEGMRNSGRSCNFNIFKTLKDDMSPDDVGYKAANLARLHQEGFTVPKTLILPHSLFMNKDYHIDTTNINIPPPWIVRSSCLEEDTENESNAGKYKSIVVNSDRKNLDLAIKEVIEHAKKMHSTPSVIIQEYIEGDYYGVGFSKYLLDNNAYLPVTEYSSKAQAVTGGTDKVDRYHFLGVGKEKELMPPLPFLQELGEILKKVENTFHSVQDIEYVVKDNLIYLLQSRDCVDSSGSEWRNWTSRYNTPIFPCLFKAQVTQNYKDQYDSSNQYIIVYDNKGVTHFMYNKNDIKSFQNNWIRRLENSDFDIDLYKTKLERRLQKLIAFASSMKEFTNFESSEEINNMLEQYKELYAPCVDMSNETFLGGFVLEKYLKSWLDSYLENKKLDYTNAQIFNILTSVKEKDSRSGFLKKEILEFVNNLSEQHLLLAKENDFNGFISLLKKEQYLYEQRNTILQKYKWLGFNRIGPGLTEEIMFDIMKGNLMDNKIVIKEKKLPDKQEMFTMLEINADDQYLFNLLGHFIYLKDWRNGMYSQASYYFFQWLSEVCKIKNIPIKSLYTMSFDEIKKTIMNGINIGNDYDLTLWTQKDNQETVLHNQEAKKFMEDKGIFLHTEFDKNGSLFYGESVSEGVVEGKARILKPDSKSEYNKTNIVIAPSIHPTETGIIANAGGIIVEEGGITSHISILAREAGIPCIINFKNACKIINEGDDIILDANSGYVKRNV